MYIIHTAAGFIFRDEIELSEYLMETGETDDFADTYGSELAEQVWFSDNEDSLEFCNEEELEEYLDLGYDYYYFY